MTSQGGPYSRFKRALATGNLLLIRAAAAELPAPPPLDDALQVCLVMRWEEPDAYERATLRWLGRYAHECALTLGQLKRAVAAFERLPRDPDGAALELRALARRP